jgi:threonine dehydrogenase-like Zn-dependent dehydrogenase
MHRQGGMAEEVTVQVEHLYRLPADLPMRTAVLTEPLAVCVHATRLAPIGLGDRVLVLGCGSIGLLAIAAARAAGAAEVWATARHPHQAAAARALGAARVFAGAADGERELAALAREHAVDVVVETVGGSADTLTTAVHCARPGGVVVVLGVFLSRPALDALSLVMKEVRLIGSIVYNRNAGKADFAVAVDLLAARQSELAPLITHCFALDAVEEAFTTAAAKSSGAIKVIVEP